jgi:hypothetical protein
MYRDSTHNFFAHLLAVNSWQSARNKLNAASTFSKVLRRRIAVPRTTVHTSTSPPYIRREALEALAAEAKAEEGADLLVAGASEGGGGRGSESSSGDCRRRPALPTLSDDATVPASLAVVALALSQAAPAPVLVFQLGLGGGGEQFPVGLGSSGGDSGGVAGRGSDDSFLRVATSSVDVNASTMAVDGGGDVTGPLSRAQRK